MSEVKETPIEIKYLDLNCSLLIDHVNDATMSEERRLNLAKIIHELERIMSNRQMLKRLIAKELYDEAGLTDKDKETRDNCYEVHRIFKLNIIELVCSL